MFDYLNKLNLKLQGQQTHFLQFKDVLSGFLSKVQNWHRKVTEGNIAMFTNLSQLLNPEETLFADLQVDIAAHLKSLEDEFKNYFPDLDCGEEAFVRNPFTPGLDITVIADDIQDELLELRHDSSARDTFLEKSLAQFWCSLQESYPQVSKTALRVIVPFASTYLCESGFSTLVQLKTKARNKLDVADDMRLALSKTSPRISRLVAELQAQPSH